jgi:hypothetical protein
VPQKFGFRVFIRYDEQLIAQFSGAPNAPGRQPLTTRSIRKSATDPVGIGFAIEYSTHQNAARLDLVRH